MHAVLCGCEQYLDPKPPALSVFCTDPTQMGGLSMLLLAGEHALTAREVRLLI